MKTVRTAVGRMLALLAVGVWLLWWLMVPPPRDRVAGPRGSGTASGMVSYLPLDAERARFLPAIWSPIWLPSGIGSDGPGAQERLLNVPMDLASPMPYVSLPDAGLGGLDGNPTRGGPAAFKELTERHMARPLALPSVIGGPAPLSGLQLQVEPPVPDLESSLGKLEKDLGTITASIAAWNVLLIVNADAKGLITHVLVERSSGDPEVDSALVRWAYQLSVGPGWDRDFIRLTLTR